MSKLEASKRGKLNIVKRAECSRRISIKGDEIEKTVKGIFHYIDLFNGMDEFSTRILNMEETDIPVLNEFKDFIIPKSVRFNPSDRRTKDLLIREDVKVLDESYKDYLDLLVNFRRYFKKDINSDFVSLSSLRTHKSLNDVLPIAAFKDKVDDVDGKIQTVWVVRYDNNPFIPLAINFPYATLFNDVYFNAHIDDVVDDFIANLTL